MEQTTTMSRYSTIIDKNPREIVLLRGSGCRWKRCTFCDYHLDSSPDVHANYLLNKEVLSHVTGTFGTLEVINSGSFPDLDNDTMTEIKAVCLRRGITRLHFECHWMHRKQIPALREYFAAAKIELKLKIGIETFDAAYREEILHKGLTEPDPAVIAEHFQECCLLFGLAGQSITSMKKDIDTGLAWFERVCINIMVENTTAIKPDANVIRGFIREIYPLYKDNGRVDILLNNTDFGVGGTTC